MLGGNQTMKMYWIKYLPSNKNLSMKKIILTLIFSAVIITLSGCASSNNPPVKKSNTGICHKEGTLFYKNTKNFTPYDSIEECLNSGGRLPKK